MKEPFVPKSTISQMLPLNMRREFLRRILISKPPSPEVLKGWLLAYIPK